MASIIAIIFTHGDPKETWLCLICRWHNSSLWKNFQTAWMKLWSNNLLSNHTKTGEVFQKSVLAVKIKVFIISIWSVLLTVAMHQHSCVRSHLPVSSRALLCTETYLTDNYEHRTADLTSQAAVVWLQNIYSKPVFLNE